MILSQHQKDYFKTFGYLRLPGMFAHEIEEISRHFDQLFETFPEDVVNWVHEVHDNRERRFISRPTDKDPYLKALLDDERVQGIASSLAGDGYIFTGSDASIYNCGTNFHQDGPGMVQPGEIHLKMALYLDPVDADSGALRLMPGTHYLKDTYTQLAIRNIWLGDKKLPLKVEEVPATVVPSQPGDLLIWNYRVLHATAYAGNQRRMLALEFQQAPAEIAQEAPPASQQGSALTKVWKKLARE